MAEYYKITKAQADQIGEIQLSDCELFDPYVGEQTDGSYLIEVSFHDSIKDKVGFNGVDFTKLVKLADVMLKPKLVKIRSFKMQLRQTQL